MQSVARSAPITRTRLPGEGPGLRRGIVFALSTLQSVISGAKTQTRRIVNPQPDDGGTWAGLRPYGVPGSRLWIREMWRPGPDGYLYAVDHTEKERARLRPWQSALHMPRDAARLVIEVESIRMEQVQRITERDALAEGVVCRGMDFLGAPDPYTHEVDAYPTAIDAFASWWDFGHGSGAWDRNEWVWAIDFRLVP